MHEGTKSTEAAASRTITVSASRLTDLTFILFLLGGLAFRSTRAAQRVSGVFETPSRRGTPNYFAPVCLALCGRLGG
jgi:hypothetical protein